MISARISAPRALRVLQFFENQNTRAFADDEAIAVLVERAAGMLRIVVARRKSAHRRKAAHAHRGNGGFRAAGNHDVGVVAFDDSVGVAHGVGAGGARRRRRFIGSLGAIADAHLAGGEIDDGRGNKKW